MSTGILRFVALAAAFLLPSRIDALAKPALNSNGLDSYSKPLANVVEATNYTYKAWPADTISKGCSDHIEAKDTTLVTTYEVTYANCGQSWHLCRHANASIKLETMFDVWGKLPVKMKQSVSAAMWLPHNLTFDGFWAYTSGSEQVYFGGWSQMNTYVHENIHAMDYTDAFNQSYLANSTIWKDAYAADSNVITEYGRMSLVEDLAETGVVALYDSIVPGGAGQIQANITKVQHQLDTLKDQAKRGNYGGDAFNPDPTIKCTHRWPNPKQISKPKPSSRIMVRDDNDEAHIEDQRIKARAMGITLFNDIPGFKPRKVKRSTHHH